MEEEIGGEEDDNDEEGEEKELSWFLAEMRKTVETLMPTFPEEHFLRGAKQRWLNLSMMERELCSVKAWRQIEARNTTPEVISAQEGEEQEKRHIKEEVEQELEEEQEEEQVGVEEVVVEEVVVEKKMARSNSAHFVLTCYSPCTHKILTLYLPIPPILILFSPCIHLVLTL